MWKKHPLLHNWLSKAENSNSWQVSHRILTTCVGTYTEESVDERVEASVAHGKPMTTKK